MPAFFLEIIPNFLITKISLREFSTTFRNEPGKDLDDRDWPGGQTKHLARMG